MLAQPGGEMTQAIWMPVTDGEPRVWRLLRSAPPGPILAIAMWIDGQPTRSGLRERLRLALSSIAGAIAPVTITPDRDWAALSPAERMQAEQQLVGFLQQRPDLTRQIPHIAGGER